MPRAARLRRQLFFAAYRASALSDGDKVCLPARCEVAGPRESLTPGQFTRRPGPEKPRGDHVSDPLLG